MIPRSTPQTPLLPKADQTAATKPSAIPDASPTPIWRPPSNTLRATAHSSQYLKAIQLISRTAAVSGSWAGNSRIRRSTREARSHAEVVRPWWFFGLRKKEKDGKSHGGMITESVWREFGRRQSKYRKIMSRAARPGAVERTPGTGLGVMSWAVKGLRVEK
jgi:hypothetical protein